MRYFPQGLSFKVTSSEQLSLSISLCILPLCNYSLSQQIVSLIRLTTIHIIYCSYLFLVFLSHILPCRGKDYSHLLHRCTRSIWHNFCHRVGVQIFVQEKATKTNKYCICSAEQCFSHFNKGEICHKCLPLIKILSL